MKRRWKILLVVVGALAVLLAVNTVVVRNQTKPAEVTVEEGRILELPGGDVQVVEQGASATAASTRPTVVLLHCYACSLRWHDRLAPLLARNHRVIRIDLLGHGGSEKPSSGYGITEQADLVAGAMNELGVEGAVVVGHSMGFSVAVALAERSSQLVDRLVNLNEGPAEDSCSLPLVAKLAYAPVLGEAMWRVLPDFVVEDGYDDAFAPGYDPADGFPNPDQLVTDYNAMTFTAFREAYDANSDYIEAVPLDERVTQSAVPLLSIFGAEDQICEVESSQAAYGAVPGARITTVDGAGHSPNVEQPAETARLIAEFTADAGDEDLRPPRNVGRERPGGRGGTGRGKGK